MSFIINIIYYFNQLLKYKKLLWGLGIGPNPQSPFIFNSIYNFNNNNKFSFYFKLFILIIDIYVN